MYASIRRYKFKPGSYPGIALLVKEQFLPILNQSPGFISYSVITEGNDAVTSISVFDSQEQAADCNEKALDWAKVALASFLAEPPRLANGEVMIQHEAAIQVE